MKKRFKGISTILLSIAMTLVMSVVAFAEVINIRTECEIILKNGGDIAWDGSSLTIGNVTADSCGTDEGALLQFKTSEGNKQNYFISADITKIKDAARAESDRLNSSKVGEGHSLDVVKNEVKTQVGAISDGMKFEVSFNKGMALFGSGFKGTIEFIINILIVFIWIALLLTIITDIACCAVVPMRELFGIIDKNGALLKSRSEMKNGIAKWLTSNECVVAINKEESEQKNAVLTYLKSSVITIGAVIIATIAVPSGGIFTLVDWLLSFIM